MAQHNADQGRQLEWPKRRALGVAHSGPGSTPDWRCFGQGPPIEARPRPRPGERVLDVGLRRRGAASRFWLWPPARPARGGQVLGVDISETADPAERGALLRHRTRPVLFRGWPDASSAELPEGRVSTSCSSALSE